VPPLSNEAEVLSATNLARYENLIDPTDFNLLRGYLKSPDSPIDYLLHVKERFMLAPLAARVDEALKTGQPLDHILNPLVNEGSLKISSRHLLPPDLFQAAVNPDHVSKQAASQVIYLPPFYVAHTPGLFAEQTHAQTVRQPDAAPAKLTDPSKESNPSQVRHRGHEMSH
jgi:hypothetical protein